MKDKVIMVSYEYRSLLNFYDYFITIQHKLTTSTISFVLLFSPTDYVFHVYTHTIMLIDMNYLSTKSIIPVAILTYHISRTLPVEVNILPNHLAVVKLLSNQLLEVNILPNQLIEVNNLSNQILQLVVNILPNQLVVVNILPNQLQ